EIGSEVGVAHVGAMAEKANPIGHTEPPRLAFIAARTAIADNEQAKRVSGGQKANRVQQGLQAFKPIVHRGKECDRLVRTQAPSITAFHAAPWPVCFGEAVRVYRAAN